jgi:hypothetical protein
LAALSKINAKRKVHKPYLKGMEPAVLTPSVRRDANRQSRILLKSWHAKVEEFAAGKAESGRRARVVKAVFTRNEIILRHNFEDARSYFLEGEIRAEQEKGQEKSGGEKLSEIHLISLHAEGEVQERGQKSKLSILRLEESVNIGAAAKPKTF